MHLISLKKRTLITLLIVITASNCSGESNQDSVDKVSTTLAESDRPSSDTSPGSTPLPASETSTIATAQVESPFYSGVLELTDRMGWIYSVEVPPLVGIQLEIEKDVSNSPPGKASTVVNASSGNLSSIRIVPNTPGRNPPEVEIASTYIFRLPLYASASTRFEVGLGYETLLVGHSGTNCNSESTDFDPSTDDNEVYIQNLLIAAFICESQGNYLISEADEYGGDELLVDNFLGLFTGTPLGVIVGLTNGCFLMLDDAGSYNLIGYESRVIMLANNPIDQSRPMPWQTDSSCQLG